MPALARAPPPRCRPSGGRTWRRRTVRRGSSAANAYPARRDRRPLYAWMSHAAPAAFAGGPRGPSRSRWSCPPPRDPDPSGVQERDHRNGRCPSRSTARRRNDRMLGLGGDDRLTGEAGNDCLERRLRLRPADRRRRRRPARGLERRRRARGRRGRRRPDGPAGRRPARRRRRRRPPLGRRRRRLPARRRGRRRAARPGRRRPPLRRAGHATRSIGGPGNDDDPRGARRLSRRPSRSTRATTGSKAAAGATSVNVANGRRDVVDCGGGTRHGQGGQGRPPASLREAPLT